MVFDFWALILADCSNRLSERRHQRADARSCEGARLPNSFLRPGRLALLCGLIALGGTTAGAAGIGVNLKIHAQNIPRAVAGAHNPHVGVGAGAQAPSRPHLNTRGIQFDGAGETTAIKSRK
jgi:hypothetical protein